MQKLEVIEMGNWGKVNVIIIEKGKDFLNWLDKVLYESYEIYAGERCSYDVKDMVDVYETFEEKGILINVFYGKKKVFISFITSLSKRDKFIEVIQNHSKWAKSKKTTKKKN